MASVFYTQEYEDKGWTVECDVSATVVPYVPARTNCRNDDAAPTEGGYLEDVTFKVVAFWVDVCGVPVGVELSDVVREMLEVKLKEDYDKTPGMQEAIWSMFENY